MSELKKHCNTCAYSYMDGERDKRATSGRREQQHCSNAAYNSPSYTSEMLLEDWDKGCCRFWTPKIEKGTSP